MLDRTSVPDLGEDPDLRDVALGKLFKKVDERLFSLLYRTVSLLVS